MTRNILVYRVGQLGDTLASLPAIRALRDAYPDDNFILLTDKQPGDRMVSSWSILEATGLFASAFFYTPPHAGIRDWLALIRLALQIRRKKPQAIFYLRDFSWNYKQRDRFFFKRVCGIPDCYGFEAHNAQVFGHRDISGKLARYPREVDYYLNSVSRWGIRTPEPGNVDFALPLGDQERARIDAFWREANIPETAQVIGLAPGSKMPAKRWPLERFVEVGKRILRDLPESRLVVFGGSEDREPGDQIVRSLGSEVSNAAGKLTLFESAEALRRCRVYVGNDTGTMHLAAAVGTPCVAIFSARDHPGRWDPYGSNHIVLRTDPPCAGCRLEVCVDQDMKCLKDIAVGNVMTAITQVLGVSQRSPCGGIGDALPLTVTGQPISRSL